MKINFVTDIFEGETWEDNKCYRKDLPSGSAQYAVNDKGEPTSLLFICPCGCGQIGGLPMYTGQSGYGWKWDGNKEEPTLTPSVQMTGTCRWHGFLTKGNWTSC